MVLPMKNRDVIEKVSMDGEEGRAQPRLTRADWLTAALEVLVETGIDSVRITRLAERLGVTRGSFYWHFTDRAQLLGAMLEVWEQTNTASVIRAASSPGTIEDRVLALFMCWLDPDLFDPRLDLAVRDWARGDAKLQSVISEADRRRMEAITAMFADHGFAEREAVIRARNFYYTQMGYYALNVQEPLAERLSFLPIYFETYTDRKLSPSAERVFAHKMAEKAALSEGE